MNLTTVSSPPTDANLWETGLIPPSAVFLEKVQKCELETWDHRAHLRIGWLYLIREGRQEGLKKIFASIRHFIENSTLTHRSKGTTFHETLTYFWVHMIHYAIVATKNPTNDFKGFLVLNPQLSNGGYFLDFYKKETMMNNPAARTQVVLPDIKPLPSIIASSVADPSRLPADSSKGLETRLAEAKVETDEDFLAAFEARALKGWGHRHFLRVIFVYLRKKGRQQGAKEIFSRMEQLMGNGYHLSITYFWIQMVDFAIARNTASLPPSADFAQFAAGISDLLQDEKLYLEYYKKETIFSPEAEKGMVLPDKKKLPTIVPGKK